MSLAAGFTLGCPAAPAETDPLDDTDPVADSDTDAPADTDLPDMTPDRTFDLRVRDLGFSTTYVHHDDGSGWTAPPGSEMTAEGPWRRYTRDIDPTRPYGSTFTLNDGGPRWYPGGSGNNFRGGGRDLWVSEGLLFTHDVLTDAASDDEFIVLTVNLHTWQEADAEAKLDHVVDVIAALGADLVALQECAQSIDAPVVEDHLGVAIKSDNMARRIAARLQERHDLAYQYFWDWHHYGFDRFEEGLAVMAPVAFTMRNPGSDWVSDSRSIYDPLNARKVVYATFDTTDHGQIVLVSGHLSWGTEQNTQIDRARAVVEDQITENTRAAFIAGDFNADAGGAGYQHMTADGRYVDSYIAANAGLVDDGLHDPTTDEGTRIDYVFQYTGISGDRPAPITAQRLFLDLSGAGQGHPALQRVSDHRGVAVRFLQP